MPFTGHEVVVDAPPLRPPASGLVQAAQVIDHPADDGHWLGGIAFQGANQATVELYDLCSANGTVALAEGATSAKGVGTAFAAVIRDQCSGLGWTAVNFQQRALEGLYARESWAVERQFERNILGISGFTNLAQPVAAGQTTQPVGTTACHAYKALALLDQAIADADFGQGMIHAQPYVVDLWAYGGGLLVAERGGRILSPQGNIIVSGNGYSGAAPTATVPAPAGALPADGTTGSTWAYATGLVVLHREQTPQVYPGSLTEALDRSVNTIRYRAQRAYAIARNGMLNAAVSIAVNHTAAP